MTRTEAEKIARVIGHADNGCHHCVSQLAEILNESGLGFRWVATGGEVTEECGEDEIPDRYAEVVVVCEEDAGRLFQGRGR